MVLSLGVSAIAAPAAPTGWTHDFTAPSGWTMVGPTNWNAVTFPTNPAINATEHTFAAAAITVQSEVAVTVTAAADAPSAADVAGLINAELDIPASGIWNAIGVVAAAEATRAGAVAGIDFADVLEDDELTLNVRVTRTNRDPITVLFTRGTGGDGGDGGDGGTPPPPPPNNNFTAIPANWTVDGITPAGELRIEAMLSANSNFTITGDSNTGTALNNPATLATLRPSDFYWRVPNTALVGGSGGGWSGDNTWTWLVNNTVATINITEAQGNLWNQLRSTHFNRANLRTTRTIGFSGVVRDVRLQFPTGGGANIQVRSVEFLTRTGDNDIEFDLSLAITGSSTARMGRAWGTIANEEIEVWDDQEFIDPTHQQFITADGTIRGLEIYAGNNMYVTRNITSGQELYIATELATHDDVFTELFREHRDLVDVIRVHTSTGWGAAGINVRFDTADTLFVFGGPQRALLGTTDDRELPMSGYYFLARSLINLGGAADGGTDAPVEDNNDSDFDGIPPTGGDVAPPNANFNPGTGR